MHMAVYLHGVTWHTALGVLHAPSCHSTGTVRMCVCMCARACCLPTLCACGVVTYRCAAYAVAWTKSQVSKQVVVEGEASGMSGNWKRTSRRLRL